ncbi:MAG: hypothetical protein EB084_09735 [Proteobacteria bacterium]|nr:hypothetical protein [Pseudomonadota bacterium]
MSCLPADVRRPCVFILRCALVAVALLTCVVPARADKRDYLETYPYWTPRQGEIEFEVYNGWYDRGLPEHQIEVEYGVTDRFTTGVYGVWGNEGEGGGTRFNATKLELRYRLAPYRTLPVDPTLYVEYEKATIAGGADRIEGKLILSKDIGLLNVTTNLNWEKSLRPGEQTMFEYTVAASYPVSRTVTLGLEIKNNEVERLRELIPGVYWQLSRRTRLNIGPAIPLRGSAPVNIRSIFSWEL